MRKATLFFVLFFIGILNGQERSIVNVGDEILSETKGFSTGDIVLSGAIGFSQTSFGDQKNISIEFSPRGAYFVSNHFAIGIVGGFNMTTIDDDDEVGSDPTDVRFSVGPIVRYYRTPSKSFSFFGEIGFLYNTTNQNSGGVAEIDSTTNGIEFAISPGISYFISKHFALEASIGLFKTQTIKSEEDDVPSKYIHTSRFDLTDLSVGLVYKL